MGEKMTMEQVRAFWTQQALEHGQSPAASWSDVQVMELEIRELFRRIADGDRVLDVGCANGFSTMRYAAERDVRVRGLDYIPAMIESAKARLAAHGGELASRVEFAVGDILSLPEADAAYDKVVVVRVLINLGEWQRQARALGECARVLRRGGLLLLSEATLQGWRNLNAMRAEFALPAIPMPGFNAYLDQEVLLEAAKRDFELVEVVDFASSYYVWTRVVKPLLARAAPGPVEVADPAAHWNRWAATLPPGGDYGTQKLFVLRRR